MRLSYTPGGTDRNATGGSPTLSGVAFPNGQSSLALACRRSGARGDFHGRLGPYLEAEPPSIDFASSPGSSMKLVAETDVAPAGA